MASEQRTKIVLSPSAELELIQALSHREAQRFHEQILEEVPLSQKSIVLFGKEVREPRLVGWAGEVEYTYSGKTLTPRPMGPVMKELLALSEGFCGAHFNHALINHYRNGMDSMGMHSDDERELGSNPQVVSWSFGATRTFVVAAKRGPMRVQLELSHGSLLCMRGDMQHHFRHGLPKRRGLEDPRLNVTFRLVMGRSGKT